MNFISGTTAIIGYPIQHSLSPVLHTYIYEQLGLDVQMGSLETKDIATVVEKIKSTPYVLSAVTMPHKQSIMPLLDKINDRAREIGSVNTVLNQNGTLIGHNTDIVGIEKALQHVDIEDKIILLLGAGGAARPVAYFAQKNNATLLCTNRNIEKAEQLVAEFGGKAVQIEAVDPASVDVIVNATPIGMHEYKNKSPLPREFLQKHHVVFDMIYHPLQTRLLQDAKAAHAQTISGIEMFVSQGLAQIELLTSQDMQQYREDAKQVLEEILSK